MVPRPFVRFIALGALIFAIDAAVGHHGDAGDKYIVVGDSDVASLRAMALKQWGREPAPVQMGEMLRAFVREEVLVREARVSGLNRDDVIVRRRLAQKMEFLAQANVSAPDEAALRAHFHAHAADYATPPRLSLEQIVFSAALCGNKVEADARRALAALQAGQPVQGDRFTLDVTQGNLIAADASGGHGP